MSLSSSSQSKNPVVPSPCGPEGCPKECPCQDAGISGGGNVPPPVAAPVLGMARNPSPSSCGPLGCSQFPVRYANGEIQLSVTDLAADGFGLAWGHTRTYSNRLSANCDFGQGRNWLVRQWAYLADVHGDGSLLAVVLSPRESYWFTPGDAGYVACYGAEQTLTHDEPNAPFRFAQPDGQVWIFDDCTTNDEGLGRLVSVSAPGGQTLSLAYNQTTGKLSAASRNDGTTTETFVYDYDAQTGQLAHVTLQRGPTGDTPQDLRRAAYTYYGDSESFGSLGDLKLVEIQLPDGQNGWTTLDTHYYRYVNDGTGLLTYVFGPEAYRRLAAAADPLTADNSTAAEYADNYFAYDDQQRVLTETVAGGTMTFSFAYTANPNAPQEAYNHWQQKTVETLPDLSTRTVYTNHIGQVLLEKLASADHSQTWIDYYGYDDLTGRQVLHAHPSAVIGYNDQYPDLVDPNSPILHTDAGLIELTDYYIDTTADETTPGQADGQVMTQRLQHGSAGAPLTLSRTTYYKREGGAATVYPVAQQTVYRDEAGTQAITTGYAYTWHEGTTQIAQRTVTLPLVSTGQNGPGESAVTTEVFDLLGNLVWRRDAAGVLTHYEYDPATGARTRVIADVDVTQVDDAPAGWTTPEGAGLHLVTDFESDAFGRITQTLGPIHNAISPLPPGEGPGVRAVRTAGWTVYRDAAHEIRQARGYVVTNQSADDDTLVNPITITRYDSAGRTTDQMVVPLASPAGRPDGTEPVPQSSWVRWSKSIYGDDGRLAATRVYHTIPDEGEGQAGTNYDETAYEYLYKPAIHADSVRAPGGTVTRSTYDPRGLVLLTLVGTDGSLTEEGQPTTTNNLVPVASRSYDIDGNLTQQTAHVDADANNDRVTSFAYDWRNRLITTTGEESTCTVQTYDNLGRVVTAEQFNGSSSGDLLAHSETCYNDLGQVYRTVRYAIADAAAHTLGNHLTSNTWHDLSGRVVKEQPGGSRQWTKYAYDSLGRQVERFVGYDGEAGELIFEQSRLDYGCCGDLANTTTWLRLPDATGVGVLNGPSGDQPRARVSYQGYWYDEIGRQIAIADYGTNGDGSEPVWPDTIPERCDDVLVTTTEYDDSGAAYKTVDPAGREDRTEYDHASRVVSKIEDYGRLARTVNYSYTPDGQIATLTAVNPETGNQVTRYLYGTLPGAVIMRNDLLRAEIYPDSTDDGTGEVGTTAYDRIEYTYNRQGQQTSRQDQNGTVRSFAYDKLGRLTGDTVTTLGTGMDGTVLAISRTYNTLGLPEKVTSTDSSNSVANEVAMVYNSLGLLVQEYQEHAGAVDMNTSLSVQYGYDDTADDGELTHGLRPVSVTYSNGRVVAYQYSPGDDDAMNRISTIADGASGPTLSRYTRLGLNQIVAEEYPEPRLRYDLTHDNFAGLDRFGRVVDHLWRNDRGIYDVVRIRHGYDRAGNRLWREDAVARSMGLDHDESYAYDSLNQLVSYAHGGLNTPKTAISAPTLRQAWDLDATGNWSRFREDTNGDGKWDQIQTRQHDAANEITSFSDWSTPTYDAAGNMTAIPKPSDPSVSLTCVYDAWNRLVSVTDAAVIVGQYSYDGRSRRIVKAIDSRSPGDPQGIDTYEHIYLSGDQVIETRGCSSPTPALCPPTPSFQFVWSLRYIDAPILRDADIDADGQCDYERLYYLNDPNFNVVALADIIVDIAERYVYSAYGKPSMFTGDWSVARTGSRFAQRTLYTGRELDLETGFGYFRARYYSIHIAAFSTRDPVLYHPGDANLYRYVKSRPLIQTDPEGLFECTLHGKPVSCWTLAKCVTAMTTFAAGATACNFGNMVACCAAAGALDYVLGNCHDGPLNPTEQNLKELTEAAMLACAAATVCTIDWKGLLTGGAAVMK